jgi:hypothetical protein
MVVAVYFPIAVPADVFSWVTMSKFRLDVNTSSFSYFSGHTQHSSKDSLAQDLRKRILKLKGAKMDGKKLAIRPSQEFR